MKKRNHGCLKALEPMGEEYLNVVKEGLENRWVDVYENKGKRSGGYLQVRAFDDESVYFIKLV